MDPRPVLGGQADHHGRLVCPTGRLGRCDRGFIVEGVFLPVLDLTVPEAIAGKEPQHGVLPQNDVSR